MMMIPSSLPKREPWLSSGVKRSSKDEWIFLAFSVFSLVFEGDVQNVLAIALT